MAKMQRKLKFYAADNDLTCVKMAVLNFLVNSMEGEVAWMNTLSMEHYRSYHIKLILADTHYLPVLSITGANETNFVTEKLKPAVEEMKRKEEAPKKKTQEQPAKPQLLLFD